jgi:hypothetical protein
LVPFTTVSSEFEKKIGAPHGSCGGPPSHSLDFGCGALFFGKLPTEPTEDKSASVTPTEVQL